MADNLFQRYAAAQARLNQSGGVRRGASAIRQYENTTRQKERQEEETRRRRAEAAEAWTTRYNNGQETLPQDDVEIARQKRAAARRYEAAGDAWRTGEDNSISMTAEAETRRRMAARANQPAPKPERKDFESPTNRKAFDRLALSDEAQKGGKPSEIQYRLNKAGLHGAANSEELKQAKAIQYMQEWDGKSYADLKTAYDEAQAAYESERQKARQSQKDRETENMGFGHAMTLMQVANLGQSGADAYDRQHENEKFHLDLLKAYLADRYKAQESPEAQAKNRIESEVTSAPDFAANKAPKVLEGDAPKLFTKDRETYETARRISKMLADPAGTDAKRLSMDETLGKVNFMEPSERDVASYLLNTRGYKAMVEYFNSLKPLLDDRAAEDQQQRTEAFADKHGTLATAASIAMSPFAGLVGAADLATQGVKKAFTGQPLDFNTPSQRNSAMPETLSGTVAEKINREYGAGWSFLYQTGVSTANSLLASYAGGPALGATILATGAGASAARDIAARGGSDEQALAGGLLAGVFEGLFEKYSLSEVKALRTTGRSSLRSVVADVAKSALTNAQEEAATELANAVTDYLLMGDLSKLSQKVEAYKTSGGMSAKEASKQAILDTIGEIVLAGAGGALSGAAMTGIGAAINAVGDAKTGRQTAPSILDQALLMDDRAESYRLAKALAAKQTPLTAAERGNLIRFMQLDAANGLSIDPAKYKAAQTAPTVPTAAQTAQPTSKTADALQALKAGKQLTNSQAESILASPEAVQQLTGAGIKLNLEGKTKAAQRAELKALSGAPELQNIQAMSFSGAPAVQNSVFAETANDTAQSQNASQTPSQPQETQAAHSPSHQWLGDAKKSGEGQSRSLSDLRKFTESKLKLTVAEKEMFMRSAIGEFMTKSENVHVRQTNDLPVLAHEAGHAMDKRFSLLKKADPVVRSELERNLSPAMKQAYPAQLHAVEGLAEFFRETMLNADAAAKAYPAMTQYLQTAVDAKTWQNLQEVFAESNRYFGSDALTRYGLVFNPTTTETSRLEALKSRDTYTQAKEWWLTHITDDLYGAKKVADLTGSRDIEFAVRATRNAQSQAAQCVLQGVTDVNGQKTGGSLVEAMKAGNLNFDDQAHRAVLNTYLGIKHALEDQNRGVQIFADPTLDSQSSMLSALASLEAQYPGIQDAAKATVQFVKDVRNTWLVGTGLISKAQAAIWDRDAPNYVPMNRFFENDTKVSKKKSKSGDGQVVHRQYGSARDVNPILDNIISFTNNAVQAGRLNRARAMIFQSIHETEGLGWLADLAPKQTKVETLKTDQAAAKLTKDAIAEVASRGYDIDAEEVEDILQAVLPSVLTRTTKVARKGGDYVSYFKDGKEVSYHVHDKTLFAALEAMKPETIGPVARFIAKMNRKFTSFVTTLNPAFNIASNPARDFQTAMMTQDSMSEFGGLLAEVARNTKPFLQEMFTGSGSDQTMREYFALGGWGEGVSGNTNAVFDSSKDSQTVQKLKQAKRTAGEAWEGFSGGIEQYLRANEYVLSRKAGMSAEEALFRAANITTDFSRGGVWSKKINRVVPFFNAGLQGLTKEYRYLTGLDRKAGQSRVKTASKRLTHFALTSIVLGSLEALAGTGFDPGDKEAEEAYSRLSTYQKNNSYCIYIGNGKFFTVRKPRELGILTSLTARLVEEELYNNENALYDFGGYSMDQLLPKIVDSLYLVPGGMGSTDGGSQFFGTAVNSLGWIGSPLGAILNIDYRGNPIVPANLEGVEAWQQYNDKTSKLAKAAGKALGWSPMKIDYALKSLGFVQTVQQNLFPVNGSQAANPLSLEGLSTTLGFTKDSVYSQDITNRFYDARSDLTTKAKTYPDNKALQAEKALYDAQATFYSRASGLLSQASSRNDPNTRTAKVTMLQMLDQFMSDRQTEDTSATVEKLKALAVETGDMSILPKAVETSIRVGHQDIPLSYAEYFAYNTGYIAEYYQNAEDILTSDADAETKVSALKKLSTAAKKAAVRQVFQNSEAYFSQKNSTAK
nr:MAG TPA: Large polyvalent protein associated domain 38 [Caudoviricetes sp.]